MPDRYCRNFQGPAAAIENTWGHIASASHEWRKGTRTWGSNSKPFEVINETGLVGVAKPGAGVGDPQLRRAAHEKLASDLDEEFFDMILEDLFVEVGAPAPEDTALSEHREDTLKFAA